MFFPSLGAAITFRHTFPLRSRESGAERASVEWNHTTSDGVGARQSSVMAGKRGPGCGAWASGLLTEKMTGMVFSDN